MKKLSKGALCGIIAAVAVVVLVIVLVLIEATGTGKLLIVNKTGKNIATFDVTFVDDASDQIVDYLFSDPVMAGEKLNLDYGESMDFSGRSVSCIMKILFEGYDTPIVVYDGQFTTKFHGTFSFTFTEDDEDYFLHAKATEGLFASAKGTDMDTEFLLWPEDAEWDYADGFSYEDWLEDEYEEEY